MKRIGAIAWLCWLGAVSAWGQAQPAPDLEESLAKSRDTLERGLMKQALEYAGRAIELAPSDPRGYFQRAMVQDRLRQFAGAESDLTRALEITPGESALYLHRGLARLRLSDFRGAIADFDRVAATSPTKGAELWQRGIALFYAGRYDEGRRQFEFHRTVNPRDVENSAWHFLCIAKLEGREKARAQWLPVSGDGRVPMTEIQALMSGDGSAEEVLRVAEAQPEGRRRSAALFYAHFYLALDEETRERRERAARHIAEATKNADAFGLMGDLARVHADWLSREMRRRR